MNDDTKEHVGIIDDVERVETKKGNSFVSVTTRDGTEFSNWNSDLDDSLFEAEGVEKCIVYEQNGQYKNVDAVLPPVQASTGQPGKSREVTKGGGAVRDDEKPPSKDTRIEKSMLWKAAASTIDASDQTDPGAIAEATRKVAVEMEKEFDRFLNGDE